MAFLRSHRLLTLLLCSLYLLVYPALGQSHPGGLDSYGCHHNRKLGGYHCHHGSLVGHEHEKARMDRAFSLSVTLCITVYQLPF